MFQVTFLTPPCWAKPSDICWQKFAYYLPARSFPQQPDFCPCKELFLLFYSHHQALHFCHKNLHTSAFVLYPDASVHQFLSRIKQSISTINYKTQGHI